jgi:hypothetical protein
MIVLANLYFNYPITDRKLLLLTYCGEYQPREAVRKIQVGEFISQAA